MSEPKDTNEAADGGSALTAELGDEGLIQRLFHRYGVLYRSDRESADLMYEAAGALAKHRPQVKTEGDRAEDKPKPTLKLVPNAQVQAAARQGRSPGTTG